MTIAILEFADTEERSGEALYPPQDRRTGLALDTAHQIGAGARCAVVVNEDGTTAVKVRVSGVSNQLADQSDIHLAANTHMTVRFTRGSRPHISAAADV